MRNIFSCRLIVYGLSKTGWSHIANNLSNNEILNNNNKSEELVDNKNKY